MDPELLRERQLFNKRAFSTPVIEKRRKDDSQIDSKPKKAKATPSSSASSSNKNSISLARDAMISYRNISAGSSYKFGVLTKIVKHLKQKFQDGEDHPMSIDEILDETNQLDVTSKVRNWLVSEALPNNPKIEIPPFDHLKFQFKPPLKCRDKKSLLRLLKQYDLKGLGGILRDDVVESVPHAERVLKALEPELIIITRQDKKKVLFYNDRHSALELHEEFQKQWRAVAVDGIDDVKIEDYLEKQGIKSMQDHNGNKKPVKMPKRKINRKKVFKGPKDNEHMANVLKFYNEDEMK